MPLKPDINREWGYPCLFLRLPHSRQLYQSLLVPSSFQDLCSMPVRHSTCMGTAHRLTRGAYRKICITPTAIRCSRSLQSHTSRRSTRSRLRTTSRWPALMRAVESEFAALMAVACTCTLHFSPLSVWGGFALLYPSSCKRIRTRHINAATMRLLTRL